MGNPTIDKVVTFTRAALARVRASGKRAAAGPRHTELILAVCGLDTHVRQGDVKISFLGLMETHASLADGLKPYQGRQLAKGTTRGSRHIASGSARLFEREEGSKGLVGPLMLIDSSPERITHPQHRHYTLPQGTVWGVSHLKDLQTSRRVID